MAVRSGSAALLGALVLVACGEAADERITGRGAASPDLPAARPTASLEPTPPSAAAASPAAASTSPTLATSAAVVPAVQPTAAPRTRSAKAATPVFRSSVSRPLTRADVRWSWRPGCPVPPSALRRLTVSYYGFDGVVRTGALVVSAGSVPAVRSMMAAAFASRFRFRSIVPIDAFYRGGRVSPERSDILSMEADNTSAFNCRPKTGRRSYSEHSWGAAIDINPYENPARSGSRIYPAGAAARYFVARRAHLRDPGVITTSSALYRAALRAGWSWGGRWRTSTDYQHFSRSGR